MTLPYIKNTDLIYLYSFEEEVLKLMGKKKGLFLSFSDVEMLTPILFQKTILGIIFSSWLFEVH